VVIENIRYEVVSHTSYSQDLAQSDLWFFATISEHLKEIHLTCDKEVSAATGKWFQEQPQEFYSDGYKKLGQHWLCCGEQEGDYMRK
jgi:hypothetical protein